MKATTKFGVLTLQLGIISLLSSGIMAQEVPYYDPVLCGMTEQGVRTCGNTCLGGSVMGYVCDNFDNVVYERFFSASTCGDAFDACMEWEGGAT